MNCSCRHLVKLQKETWARLEAQQKEKYKWTLKGVLNEKEFNSLPSIIKLSLKMIESVRAFRVSMTKSPYELSHFFLYYCH